MLQFILKSWKAGIKARQVRLWAQNLSAKNLSNHNKSHLAQYFLKMQMNANKAHYEQEKTKYQNFKWRHCYAESYIGDCGKRKTMHPYMHVLYICYGWFFLRIPQYLKKTLKNWKVGMTEVTLIWSVGILFISKSFFVIILLWF